MQTRIKIIEPCNQDWNKMTILDKDKFCEKCQKNVIDLTEYKKSQLLDFLNNNEKVCGRLDQSQLKEDFLSEKQKRSSISKLAFLISLGSILGFTEPVNAKPKEHKTEQTEIDKWKSIFPKKESDSITIEGTVLAPDGLELPGANIFLKDTKIAVQTNFDGKFSITIPTNKLKEENYLVFSFIGFETQEYRFYQKNRYINIKMVEDTTTLMGEVVIVRRANIFNKIGHFFGKLFSKKENHINCQ